MIKILYYAENMQYLIRGSQIKHCTFFAKHRRCFPLCQRFRKFRSEVKCKGPFLFPSDRNIWDHLWKWSTYFGRNIQTEIRRSIVDKSVHCPTSLHLCREFGRGIKKCMVRATRLGWHPMQCLILGPAKRNGSYHFAFHYSKPTGQRSVGIPKQNVTTFSG